MTGNDKERVVLTSRDFVILRLFLIVRFLDVEQVRIAGGFDSVRRAKRRMLRLYRAGLVKRWFVANAGGAPKAIYGLSPTGAAAIGEGRETVIGWKDGDLIVASQFLAHQQAVNTVFLAVCHSGDLYPPPAWTTFKQPLSTSIPLKPDAYFEFTANSETLLPMFLEVDRGTEPLKVWDRKASLYLKLAASGEFQRLFQKPRFRVLVIVTAEGRLQTLRETVALHTEKLFWFSTLDNINRDGFWDARWFRPKGETEVTLA